jgi:hypothetical protein
MSASASSAASGAFLAADRLGLAGLPVRSALPQPSTPASIKTSAAPTQNSRLKLCIAFS